MRGKTDSALAPAWSEAAEICGRESSGAPFSQTWGDYVNGWEDACKHLQSIFDARTQASTEGE